MSPYFNVYLLSASIALFRILNNGFKLKNLSLYFNKDIFFDNRIYNIYI